MVNDLITLGNQSVPVCEHPILCRCGCGQAVATGRKFVNQTHYDQSKGLPSAAAEQLLTRFQQGVPKKQLAREYGVALTTVRRLLRKNGLR
jgi:DNA invertase Pin-like site-specific DNA recombinase